MYHTLTQIGEEKGSGYYRKNYINNKSKKTYEAIAITYKAKIDAIKSDKKLKYIQDNTTYNNINRNNYCKSLFIKALEKRYNENDNPDIMFKFLIDFCKEDMGISMSKDNYIQIIKYFLNNPSKINDDVRQNIRSLIRYVIENGDRGRRIITDNDFRINISDTNTFIKQIITKDKDGLFGLNEQNLIQDIILIASDNNIDFGKTSKELIDKLYNVCFGDTSNINSKAQQNLSLFEIVKNLILSGNVKENENFLQYDCLEYEEKQKLQQILAKTVAVTKIIEKGKQDCSKLKDAVVKFVSGNTGLTIEDIEKIKITHKSISKFCEGKGNNKKYAHYSWFLNKLIVNNRIANSSWLSQTNPQQAASPKDIVLDTYDEFENYKNNNVKKATAYKPHKLFQVTYMSDTSLTQATAKRSKIHYQNTKSVYDCNTQQFNDGDCDSKTLKDIFDTDKDDIQSDLEKYELQQRVNVNRENSEEFKKFCAVFDLIMANTLLFNAVRGIKRTQQDGYNQLQ